jgi:hypothetical protein
MNVKNDEDIIAINKMTILLVSYTLLKSKR